VDDVGGRHGLTGLPTADGAGVHLEMAGDSGREWCARAAFR
jgi:hypothetical protein